MILRSHAAPRRTITGRRIAALTTAAVVVAGGVLGSAVAAQAATSNIASGPLDVLLGVGADETQRIASWYFPTNVNQALEIEKTSDLSSGAFDADKQVIAASKSTNGAADTSATDSDTSGLAGIANQSGYVNAHAAIKDLQPNTSYSYHVGAADGTQWSQTYTFTTKSFTGDFDFLFFGDPQIGSSGHVDDDGVGWGATLDYATTHDPKAELLVSGGDQVEHANNEYEWSAFADQNAVLKQYAWASTIGNHDVGGKAYEQHNQVPNSTKVPDFYPGGNTTANSGGDYWFIYKDVLFIDINSNAYAGGSDAEHVSYVSDVINRYGDQAKWKVLVYHHSIYSPADHANDSDNQQRRFDFTTAFSKLGVNLVLQGHDHSYSRSYAILNGKKANPAEKPGQAEVFSGPGGVIYVTANSASGSKYYDLTTPDATQGGYGADPLDPSGKRHWANSVENQEHVRTYVQVGVTAGKLNVTNVRAGDCTAPNSAYLNGKVTTCGVTAATAAPGATPDPAAVGSAVDHFVLDAKLPTTVTTISASRSTKVYGSSTPITVTATLAGGLGTQAGTVKFYDGSTLVGTKSTTGSPVSITLPSALSVGTHSVTARFTSASIFTGTSSTSGAVKVSVTKATSSTSIGYSSKKVSVSVKSKGLTVNGSARIYDGSKLVKTVTVKNGKAVASISLKRGTHKLHASFVASSTISASTSATVKVRVR